MKPVIQTYSRRIINPFEMTIDDIDIRDIAHSLSMVNRFIGHTKKPISVAQHSVYVSRICADTEYELQGLLHDAAEAYIGDMTKWVKHTPQMKCFREIEDRIQKLIFKRFNCPEELGKNVEEADRIMVRYEGIKGFGPDFKIDHPNYPPLTPQELEQVGKWGFWDWHISEELFMVHFRMCLNKR